MTWDLHLHQHLIITKTPLALAESCTGGYAAHLLTRHPGASTYFLGSFVTYASSMKTSALNVDPYLIKHFTAVSQEVVIAMLQGIFSHSQAEIGGAISGIAGPDAVDAPLGTMWIATGKKNNPPSVCCLHMTGDRFSIIEQASQALFAAISRLI